MRAVTRALRQLGRCSGLSLVVVAMLAIGIGGSTALFAVFYEVRLKPLPVAAPAELVNFRAPGEQPGRSRPSVTVDDPEAAFSYPMFRDLESNQDKTAFTGIAADYDFLAQITRDGQTTAASGLLVSGRYFDVAGVEPALGRFIAPTDASRVGESDVVVLSYDYWQSRFAAAADVLGETITVNNRALTIVGVAPENFHGTLVGWRPQIFVPLTLRWAMQPEMPRDEDDRQSRWLYVLARLRPGIAASDAAERLNVRYAAILAEIEAPLLTGLTQAERERFLARRVLLVPGARGQNPLTGAGAPAALLLGSTLLVVLIACINVANLLLARGAARRGEMAIRTAVGASRGGLVRQLLLESSLLAAAGGALSLPVAAASVTAIETLLIPAPLVGRVDLAIGWPAVAFACVVASATVLLFGLVPALRVTRLDPGHVMKSQGSHSGGGLSGRLRGGFVPAQIALSLTLLLLAGLLMRGLANVSRVDLGMNVEPVVVFGVSPLIAGYDASRLDALYDRIAERLRAEPGVRSVASASIPLMSGLALPANVKVGDGAQSAAPFTQGNPMTSPALFSTLSVPFVAGRDFTEADSLATPAVAIVNESFVRVHALGADPIGAFVDVDGPIVHARVQIVGVVRDAHYSSVKGPVLPQLFTPRVPADTTFGPRFFYVKADVDPESLVLRVPRILAEIDAGLPITMSSTLAQRTRNSVFGDRLIAALATTFAALATLLTAIGLYGVLSYNVARRTRELGLRLALGAAPGRLLRAVLKQVATMALLGIVVGLILGLALGRVAAAVIYGLSALDVGVLVAAVVVIGAVVLGASYVPARRAARLDPMRALRYE